MKINCILFILHVRTQNGIKVCLQAINYPSFTTQNNKHRVSVIWGACCHTNVSCSWLLCWISFAFYSISVAITIKTPFNSDTLLAFNETYMGIIDPCNWGGHERGSRIIQQWPITGNEHIWSASQSHLLDIFDLALNVCLSTFCQFIMSFSVKNHTHLQQRHLAYSYISEIRSVHTHFH